MARKYNYVIMGSEWDLYKQSYADISTLPDAVYISDKIIRENIWMKYALLKKVSLYLNIPVKKSWNALFFNHKFAENKPICFVFFGLWARVNQKTGLINFLKSQYPNSKFVWFLQDLYVRHPYSTTPFDLVLSYDRAECVKYGFVYHPTVFSRNFILPKSNEIEKSDVYFVGKAKNRLPIILSCYEKLTGAGFKCDFNLLGVPKGLQQYPDKIKYLKHPMSYSENLQHAQKTNCLLEVIQEGAVGYTFRLWESIAFKKKLLSNNISLKESEYYSSQYINVFDNELSTESLTFIRRDNNYDYPQIDSLSPIHLLNFIDSKI